MPARFKFSPTAGAFGLYTVPTSGSTDDSPLTDPLNNMSRVIVHPALRYPGVVGSLSGTLSLPAASGSASTVRRTHNIGSHGQSGLPMVIGKLNGIGVGGVDVPFAGSVCVQCPNISFTSGVNHYLGASRWIALGVSGGSVVVYEMLCGSSSLGPGAISIGYVIYILSRDLTTTPPNSGPSRCRINGSAFEFVTPKGTLTSEQKFIKAASGGGSFGLSGGRTVTVKYNGSDSQSTFKNSFGSGVYEVNADYVIGTTTQTLSPASAVSPTIQGVAI